MFDRQIALILSTNLKSIGLLVHEKKYKIDYQDGGHNDILDFFIRRTLAIFDLQVSPNFLQRFESIRLSVQENKRKIDFQAGDYGGNLGFLIGTILATFKLQNAQIYPSKFRVSWFIGSGKDAKNRFSR